MRLFTIIKDLHIGDACIIDAEPFHLQLSVKNILDDDLLESEEQLQKVHDLRGYAKVINYQFFHSEKGITNEGKMVVLTRLYGSDEIDSFTADIPETIVWIWGLDAISYKPEIICATHTKSARKA